MISRYVWSWARSISMAHDSFWCQHVNGTQPFPTERKLETNNFVASVFKDFAILDEKCPEACRPKDHKDWLYC